VNRLRAPGFPEEAVRRRARQGPAAGYPPAADYGGTLFGADPAGPADSAGSGWAAGHAGADQLDAARLVPPVFMPQRLEKLIDLGREPTHRDVELDTLIGGFRSSLPLYVSAFGSTVAGSDLGLAVSRQAGELGIPMVIGENVVPVAGYGRLGPTGDRSLLARLRAYAGAAPPGLGGVAVQQSTEDADAEVWNLVYSDPAAHELLASGRLAFELKVGQGAKPGLGGMTVLDADTAARLTGRYQLDPIFDGDGSGSGSGDGSGGRVLRAATPGTYTEEILRQQIRLMRNNFPEARVWVKLHPARDVRDAAAVAWAAGADAVTVDGAEGGTGWAPLPAFAHVGLPLAECLLRLDNRSDCLLVSGRVWEGTRVAKCLALGARAAGLGRAALLAADEDPDRGLLRFAGCLAEELRLLVSALGKYRPAALGREDLWWPGQPPEPAAAPAAAPDRTAATCRTEG